MDKHTRDAMDYIVPEAFGVDTIEESIDTDFNLNDVVAGDKEALAEFMLLRAAAKAPY